MGSEGLSDGRVPEGKADHFHVPLKVKKGWIYNSSIRLYVVALCLPKQKVNSQSNPCAGPEVPGGSDTQILTQSAQEGGKVVSPTHRMLLPQRP